MARYRKLPVEIAAVLWRGDNFDEVDAFMDGRYGFDISNGVHRVIIQTLEGTMHGVPGDFIVKGVHGEFYPCKPDIFLSTYEVI